MKLTQTQRLLNRLRDEGELHSWQIIQEMHILQYNARLYDAKELIGCVHGKHGNPNCTATEHIISDKDNHFIFKRDTAVKETMVDLQELIRRRDDLRRQWKAAGPEDKRILEIRGKALTNAIEQAKFTQNVKDNLI
jgi:hypothetical protein